MGLRLLASSAHNLLRRRYEPGAYDANGEYQRGAATDTPIRPASLQEHRGGRRRQVQSEGTRQAERRVLYCQLGFCRTDDDKASPAVEADEVVDCSTGKVYKVEAVSDGYLIKHQRCDLVLIREGPR